MRKYISHDFDMKILIISTPASILLNDLVFFSFILSLAFRGTTQTPVAMGSKSGPGTKYDDCTPLAGGSLHGFGMPAC
jgi:hypothetical protein